MGTGSDGFEVPVTPPDLRVIRDSTHKFPDKTRTSTLKNSASLRII